MGWYGPRGNCGCCGEGVCTCDNCGLNAGGRIYYVLSVSGVEEAAGTVSCPCSGWDGNYSGYMDLSVADTGSNDCYCSEATHLFNDCATRSLHIGIPAKACPCPNPIDPTEERFPFNVWVKLDFPSGYIWEEYGACYTGYTEPNGLCTNEFRYSTCDPQTPQFSGTRIYKLKGVDPSLTNPCDGMLDDPLLDGSALYSGCEFYAYGSLWGSGVSGECSCSNAAIEDAILGSWDCRSPKYERVNVRHYPDTGVWEMEWLAEQTWCYSGLEITREGFLCNTVTTTPVSGIFTKQTRQKYAFSGIEFNTWSPVTHDSYTTFVAPYYITNHGCYQSELDALGPTDKLIIHATGNHEIYVEYLPDQSNEMVEVAFTQFGETIYFTGVNTCSGSIELTPSSPTVVAGCDFKNATITVTLFPSGTVTTCSGDLPVGTYTAAGYPG